MRFAPAQARKCFHEKGLVRQDCVRLHGKDFNSPVAGGGGECRGRRGAPRRDQRPQSAMTSVGSFGVVPTLREPFTGSCLRSFPPQVTRFAACSSSNKWVFSL
jgi:hypothetical protein